MKIVRNESQVKKKVLYPDYLSKMLLDSTLERIQITRGILLQLLKLKAHTVQLAYFNLYGSTCASQVLYRCAIKFIKIILLLK